jgi:hypothetical protein
MSRNRKKINIVLWSTQILLALLFLFAGGMKLSLPLAAMNQGPVPLPEWFFRTIGVLEILGALGLVLPGALGIHRELTSLAAAGLVGIMAGATTMTVVGGALAPALFPCAVGLVALAVSLGRRQSPVVEPTRETVEPLVSAVSCA